MSIFRHLTACAALVVALACATPANAQNTNSTSTAKTTRNANNTPTLSAASGTAVSQRVEQLRQDLNSLRASVLAQNDEYQALRGSGSASAVQYHSSVAAITARLQQGTTPGNPILLRQWDEAQGNLDLVNTSISRLNNLSAEVAANGSLSGYLLESVKAAFLLSGAVDEDHEQLKILQDATAQTIILIESMRNDISKDLLRLTNYWTSERSNLQTLSFAINKGEMLGNSLQNRPLVVMPQPLPALDAAIVPVSSQSLTQPANASVPPLPPVNLTQPAPQPAGLSGNQAVEGRLLVLIRFNQPVVDYEQRLYGAVSGIIDQMPNTLFTIVAVSPTGGDPTQIASSTAAAQRHADAVKRSLMQMGMPADRMAMASLGSDSAKSPEVHIYAK